MAAVIEVAKRRRTRRAGVRETAKPEKPGKQRKWPGFRTATLSLPLAAELMQSPATMPPPQGRSCILEAGVLAFRREPNGEARILVLTKRRTNNWGIPKGKVSPHLSFAETAAKEAFEEAGVIGAISPSSVGMFRATKRTATSPSNQIIEVWVYLLEVTETLIDWPEKGKRQIRWVSCEAAAGQLREPVLSHLCHRLAQG